MVPILKMRRFSCILRLSLPPEMGEMAQTLMSEIEWLAALKCRATGLSTSVFLMERRCSDWKEIVRVTATPVKESATGAVPWYSGIFRDIPPYSGIFHDIPPNSVIFRKIPAYSVIFRRSRFSQRHSTKPRNSETKHQNSYLFLFIFLRNIKTVNNEKSLIKLVHCKTEKLTRLAKCQVVFIYLLRSTKENAS